MEWTAKVRRFLDGKYGAYPELARKTGIPLKSIENWFPPGATKRPRNESDVIRKVAHALGVDEGWLRDPATGWPPILEGDAPATGVRVSGQRRYRPVFECLADRRKAELLLKAAREIVSGRTR